MKIPKPLMPLRHAAGHAPLAGQASAKDWKEAWAWKLWAWFNTHPPWYRLALALGGPLRKLTPPHQTGWTAHRRPMKLARRGLIERLPTA